MKGECRVYAFPNATTSCGGPVPGGEDCSECSPPGMPPAFELTGTFENGACTECVNFNGVRLPQIASCVYENALAQICTGLDQTIRFTETEVVCDLEASTGEPLNDFAVYRKSRMSGDNCNESHVLSLDTNASNFEGVCTWPLTLTIVPTV
jgi:hypothetical protein